MCVLGGNFRVGVMIGGFVDEVIHAVWSGLFEITLGNYGKLFFNM